MRIATNLNGLVFKMADLSGLKLELLIESSDKEGRVIMSSHINLEGSLGN